LCALAFAGCGETAAKAPLDHVLRYFPARGSTVVVASTDLADARYDELNGALGTRLLGAPLRQAVAHALDAQGVPYERVVEPQLGNDLVAGAVGRSRVAALEVRDAEDMRGLLARSPLRPVARQNGAEVWVGSGVAVALDGDVVVASDSFAGLTEALAQRDGPGGLTPSALDTLAPDAPDAVLRVWSGAPEAGLTAVLTGTALRLDLRAARPSASRALLRRVLAPAKALGVHLPALRLTIVAPGHATATLDLAP
jgi:hypothetical protein